MREQREAAVRAWFSMWLEKRDRGILDLFAPNLILGISDEISSTGDIERIRLVGKIVDEYNRNLSASQES